MCNTTLGGLFSGLFGCSAQQTENSGESGNTGASATSISPAGGNVHWSYRTGVDLCPIDSPGVYTCSGAGLTNPFVQIDYNVRVVNQTTGEVVVCGGTVPAGTPLKYEFMPHEYTDINWFSGTAYFDSPYGDWRSTLDQPDGGNMCKDKNYVGLYTGGGYESGTWSFYSPLVVLTPAQNVSGLPASFGCTALSDGSMSCAPSEEGTFNPSFDFAATKGVFYLGFNRGTPTARADGSCDVNSSRGIPLSKNHYIGAYGGLRYAWKNDGTYYLEVPAQSVACPITVTPSTGNPPSTPQVSVASNGACIVGAPHSITMTATDSDNDMIRYGIDWDNDGLIDQFMPSFGYVPSGTVQIVSRTFASGGTKTVKVIAQDDNGHASSWGTVSFFCADVPAPASQCTDNIDNDGDGLIDTSDPDCATSGGVSEFTFVPPGTIPPPGIPSADLRLSVPSLIARGKTVQVVWSADYVSSCLPVSGTNGNSFAQLSLGTSFFAPIGGRTSSPITARTTYSLICVDLNGITRTKTATVNIQPNFRER